MTVVCLLWLLCTMAKPADAYIDPGSGMMIYQIVLSAFLAFLYSLGKLANRLRTRGKPE